MTDREIFRAAADFGTPFFMYDFSTIARNFKTYHDAFLGSAEIFYALKANANLHVLKMLAALGSGADCVSIFEVQKAILAGIPREKIIFSGVGKTPAELLLALKLGIFCINVESVFEFEALENLAREHKILAQIFIRVNPKTPANTHEYVMTAADDSKFGLPEDEAFLLFLRAHRSEFLRPIGLHFHIGSQICDAEPLILATQKMADFFIKLRENGVNLAFFDIGGGIGVRYSDEAIISIDNFARQILKITKNLNAKIITEPGRRIVADAGVLVTRVLGVKNSGAKNFAICDAGMNDLIRPSLYGATHGIRVLQAALDPKRAQKSPEIFDISGPVCESGDFLAKNVTLSVSPGDLIVVENAGAYGFSMSSSYNLRPRACEIGVRGDEISLLRGREDFATLLHDEEKHGF